MQFRQLQFTFLGIALCTLTTCKTISVVTLIHGEALYAGAFKLVVKDVLLAFEKLVGGTELENCLKEFMSNFKIVFFDALLFVFFPSLS